MYVQRENEKQSPGSSKRSYELLPEKRGEPSEILPFRGISSLSTFIKPEFAESGLKEREIGM